MKKDIRKQFNNSYLWVCILTLLFSLFFGVLQPITANADMGPKASVRIQFENLGDEACYATLLSEKTSTGPSSAWDGEEETAFHKGNYEYATVDYKIWKAFAEYKDKDGFYYLQETWLVNETKELAWMYYPPSTFKILLYFPDTDTFAVSEICEKYAFDTYYTVDMQGVDIGSVEYNEKLSSDVRLNAYLYYNWPPELFSFLIRVILTVAIEIGIGLLFGFRGKWQLLLLTGTNVVTQLLLNLLLNFIGWVTWGTVITVAYVILELIVLGIEGLVYSLTMNKSSKAPKKVWVYWLYAFVANLASYGTGLLLAEILPWLF